MISLAIIQKRLEISRTNIGNHLPHVAVVPRLYGMVSGATVSVRFRCSIPKQTRLKEFKNCLKDHVAVHHHLKNICPQPWEYAEKR